MIFVTNPYDFWVSCNPRVLGCLLLGLSLVGGSASQPLPVVEKRCEPTSEFALPFPASGPNMIVAGPDGNLWFSGYPSIGVITTSGVVTLIPMPGISGTRALVFDRERN